MARMGRPELEGLIPDAGAMCLLDEVVDWGAVRLHARSQSHRRADNPLRAGGVLHALNLCEYAAQAMALHGALLCRRDGRVPRPAQLAALRGVELGVVRIDDLPGALQVHVACLLAVADSREYAFRIEHRGRRLASGRAVMVLLRA